MHTLVTLTSPCVYRRLTSCLQHHHEHQSQAASSERSEAAEEIRDQMNTVGPKSAQPHRECSGGDIESQGWLKNSIEAAVPQN